MRMPVLLNYFFRYYNIIKPLFAMVNPSNFRSDTVKVNLNYVIRSTRKFSFLTN